MLTTSRSPSTLTASPSSQTSPYSPRPLRDSRGRSTKASSPIVKPHSTHVYHKPGESSQYAQQPAAQPPTQSTHTRCSPVAPAQTRSSPYASSPSLRYTSTSTQTSPIRPSMINAATQYSPPFTGHRTTTPATKATTAHIESIPLIATTRPASSTTATSCSSSASASASWAAPSTGTVQSQIAPDAAMTAMPAGVGSAQSPNSHQPTSSPSSKRSYEADQSQLGGNGLEVQRTDLERSSSKKHKPEEPAVRVMPIQYDICNTRDLVILIASMLMELIRYNDGIPLRDGQLTRFHSRAPPGISVLDYLQRLTTHATLSPPILLSMVYYIDKLCALYPSFTMTSLTVHRFLITSATVASKGLSDSFWTNRTYARVGGVSVKELALLELEFLVRMNWRIVPKPEILVDYYRSLVERSPGYELEPVDVPTPSQ